jgi:hypothetical protein
MSTPDSNSNFFQLAPRRRFGLNVRMISGTQHSRSFPGAAFLFILIASAGSPLLAGCGGGGSNATNANAHLTDSNNYVITSSLAISRLTVQEGADLHVCWTTLSTDLLKHAISPTQDIDHVAFLRIKNVSEADISAQFAVGNFDDNKVNAYFDYIIPDKSNTCANLSSFKLGASVLNPPTDFTAASNLVYMLMWATGLTPGSGSKTMLFVEPDASSTTVEVAAPEGKDILSFQADLTTPRKMDIPAAGPYVVEWGGLTKDGMGQPVRLQNIDGLIVGHYDMTIDEFQTRCLDYDRIATAFYKAAVPAGEHSLDLATAKTADGTAFAGFTPTTGFWAVALTCTKCQVPAPVAVAIVNPQ